MADSVSPGSSQRGARVTWNAHVIWPAGPAASAILPGPANVQIEAASAATTTDRFMRVTASLHTGAAQNRSDVLRLGLARAGVDLADDLDGRRRDGRGHADLATLPHDVAVHVVDLGRPALGHVLPHRGAPVSATCRGRRQHPVQRVPDVATISGRPLLRGVAVELGHAIAEREPDAGGLRRKMNGDRAAHLARGDVGGPEPGHALDRIPHGVGAKLGPALAPEILGDLRAVDDR